MRRYKATIILAVLALVLAVGLAWRVTSCEHVDDGTRYGSWRCS